MSKIVQFLHRYYPYFFHGDLWAGNFLFAGDHKPYLIDPDALFGDREFDLAMTTVFVFHSQNLQP